MYKAKIWHASEGRKFPLEVRNQGQFSMELVELPLADLASAKPDEGSFHVFLIQTETGHIASVKAALQGSPHLADYPKMIVVPESEYARALAEYRLVSRAHLMDDGVRPHNLMMAMELALQQEYYRRVVYQLSGELRKNGDVFENMLALTRKELKDSKEETAALRSLLDYESARKQFAESLEGALGELGSLRDREALDLKEQLRATERLSDYRDLELKEARAQLDATEKVLEFSRKEQMQKEEILDAMDRLRSFTEAELLELFEENLELRKKLGIEPRN